MTSADPQTLADHTDRFMRRAVSSRKVFAISGEKGLARLPSRKFRRRETTLIWSEREPAENWASFFEETANVMELGLAEVLSNLVSRLSEEERMIGVDWNQKAIEPELNPSDFAERLRLEMLESFIDRSLVFGSIWILNDTFGPALLPSATHNNAMVLPCWSDDLAAEVHKERWPEAVATRISIEDFLSETTSWLEQKEYYVTPEYPGGAGVLELEATDLKFRLADRQMTQT